MAGSKSGRSLHQLLDSVLTLHRQDIHAYSGGHLNESNLYNPEAQKAIQTGRWKKSSQARKLPPVSHPAENYNRRQDLLMLTHMKEILKEFSVDTPLRVSRPPPVKRHAMSETPVSADHPAQQQPEGVTEPYPWIDDGVLVEEVGVSDLGVPALTPRTRRTMMRLQEHTYQQQQFMPSFLEGVTKRDQFNLMKRFERDVLGLEDTKLQNLFAGHAAVEHAESHLEEGLSSLQLNGAGPNFHKLQVYSDTFDCLIKTSSTFGYLLQTIKNKYDDFVGELLDSQSGKHQALLDHMKQLSDGGTSNAALLHDDISTVKVMEQEARELLQENERLRREVQEEIKLAAEPSPEPRDPHPPPTQEPVHDLSDQVEHLNAAILQTYDRLQQLRTQMRKEFVPVTVCTHLEQCIKETEVEIQKLSSQKDYFIRSVGEMETKLTENIERADTTEKDARRIWNKIESKKPLEVPDEAEDEENKWSWYIS